VLVDVEVVAVELAHGVFVLFGNDLFEFWGEGKLPWERPMSLYPIFIFNY